MNFRSGGSSKRSRLRLQTEMLEARTMLTSQMLADFIGGENQLQTDAFHELNGETYFVRSGLEQVELWKTDGTDDGSEQVKVLASQPKHSTFSVDVKKVRDELLISLSDNYFSFWLPLDRPVQDNKYFLSDGTSDGTRSAHGLFADFQTGRTAYRVLDLEVEDDDYLLFEYGVQEPVDAPIKPTVRLGISDGTVKGTRKLTNERLTVSEAVQVGENLVASSILASFGGWTTERELWISDGITTDGEVVDLWESGDSQPKNLVKVGASVFFSAETELGRELWKSDGTADGTRIVADILVGEGSSNPTDLVALNGHVFFLADDGDGTSLWKSDGTDTAVVETSGTPSVLLGNGDQIYFVTSNEAAGELQFWQMDDASSAPALMGAIPQPAEAVDVAIQEFDEILLATISGESSSMLVSILGEDLSVLVEPSTDLYIHIHGQAQGEVFFSRDRELWKTDGILAEPVGARNLTALAEVNGKVMFSATVDETVAIWSYDGTMAAQLKPLPSKSGSIQVHSVTNIGGTSLLMVSEQASQPLEQSCFLCGPEFYTYLVATDGESFELLEDSVFPWIFFAIASPDYPQVYVADGNAYFSDHSFPKDFWKTDFTMDGTKSISTEELSKVNQLFDVSANRFTGLAEVNSPMQTVRMGTWKTSFPIGRVGQWQFERSGNTLRLAVLNQWGSYDYDSTAEPLLRDVAAASQILGRAADGAIYFAIDAGDGMQLMKGDAEGKVEAVVVTPEILALLTNANPNRESGERIYFHVFGRSGQDKIWSLGADGFDEVPLPDDVEIVEFLTVVNDHAIFLSETESHGIEIWSSDLSPTEKPKGDINGDGSVGFDDFLILSQNFGREVIDGEADGDLDGDGVVTFADFLLMSVNFSE